MMGNQLSILMLSTHGYVSSEPELGKPDTGGQVLFVLELGKRFSRLGHKVDLVTRQFEGQPEVDQVTQNFRILRIPFGGDSFIRKEDMHDHIGDFVTNFLAHIRNQHLHYDVVNSHYWDAGWAGQRIAEELDIIHIHTPHSLGWWKRQEMQEEGSDIEGNYRFDERVHKEYRIYNSCDHIIATSTDQVDIIKEKYDVDPKDITTLPPGIDEGRFYPIPREELAEVRAKFNLTSHDILLLGRLADNKGYDLLLRAVPEIQKQIPDVRVIMGVGGDDPSEKDIQFRQGLADLAVELGIDDRLIWVNYVPDEDLANYYRSAGVFVMPSRYEPFGMTAVEAMACGTPTIVTRNGALYKSLNFGTNAFFANPESIIELAALSVIALRYEDIADRLSREGARLARKKFGWTGIARSTLDLFSSLIQVRKFEDSDLI